MSSQIGPAEPGRPFPPTRCSVVHAVGDADPEVRRQAFAALAESYWKPVYKYLRVHWRAEGEDAADLTQEFFARALEKGTFGAYDPERARFRTFLRTCLDHFAASEKKAARREKRGGGRAPLSLDFADFASFSEIEAELARQGAAIPPDGEEYFHREWVRSLFAAAVEDLRSQSAAAGKGARFALFERYDLEGPRPGERLTYAQLGEEAGMSAVQVTNELAAARRDFRRLVLARLRALTASEAELRAEARLVLGVDLP
jgi:RNA polymerase sigma factor (sigma-70 family)